MARHHRPDDDNPAARDRRAKLDEIRRRVRDGSYQVDLDGLAERLLPEIDGPPDAGEPGSGESGPQR